MGKEQPQLALIGQMFASPSQFKSATSSAYPSDIAYLSSPDNDTPNQRWLALSISLGRAYLTGDKIAIDAAVAACLALYAQMAKFGHQAIGSGYGNEQCCPDPHWELWASAHAYILYVAMLLAHQQLASASTNYWANHVSACRAFMTPAGVRCPCARAIYTLAKGAVTTDPKPSWVGASRLYAMMIGLADAAAKPKYGNLSSGMQIAYDIMETVQSHRDDVAQIVALSKTLPLKLWIPVRRWVVDGLSTMAYSRAEPQNDPCMWMKVDITGEITASSNTLDNFQAPAGEPVIIG